jgi:lysine 2,3-aminomutase
MIIEKNWARELSQGLISLGQLREQNIISDDEVNHLKPVKENFDIRIPHIFLDQIKNKNNGLAKQFIPSSKELLFFPEELDDPIGDERWTPVEGITHRYPDRVLLKATYMCASYCRFCFRRYKVSHPDNNLNPDNFEKAIHYIKSHPEIWEVILTGGDPLTLTDNAIKKLINGLSAIEHLKVIRFHTRIPSVLPSRINKPLIEILKNSNKSIWIAAHINSSEEFTSESKIALAALIDNGIPVLLQSVLLKGINDTHEKLVSLLKIAIENRVKPYYLHYPDLAKGTEYFRVPLKQAIELMKGLRGKISGLCLPQFIIDIPGGEGKIVVNANSIVELDDNTWEFESPLNGSRIKVKYP